MGMMLQISNYMTLAPKVINHDKTLLEASEYMRKLHVRHLPVQKAGKIVGIVSDRDIKLALTLKDQSALGDKVEVALTPNPFFVEPRARVSDVCRIMADDKYGCILVLERGQLVGIFTVVDALRALVDVFRQAA